MELNKIYNEDCRETMKRMPDNFVDCIVTSPPYFGLRDYGVDGQLGLEDTPEKYVEVMTEVFSEARRILKKEGTLWLNLGDSYNGSGKGGNPENSKWKGYVGNKDREKQAIVKNKKMDIKSLKPKDLIGIPWMVAFALRSSGWYLRQDIIWHKPNPMPESVTDRCTKSHEYIFLMSKSAKYYYDYKAIMDLANYDGRHDLVMKGSDKYHEEEIMPGAKVQTIAERGHVRWKDKNDAGEFLKNKRSVWSVPTMPYSEAHFATFPMHLIADMIKAGCHENGIVYDPFMGSGTTGACALRLNRNFVGSELNPQYIDIAEKRINKEYGLFNSKHF